MSAHTHVAIVDDEPRMAEALAMVLRRDGHEVSFFTKPERFLKALPESSFDLLLTDLKMPKIDGIEVLRQAKATDPSLPVIMMTAYGTVPTALEAMKLGAFDYIEKPFDNQHCRSLVSRALSLTQLERENRYLRQECDEQFSVKDILVVSPQMKSLFALAKRAAKGRATILISGESGTGKEVIARAIHYFSDRVGQSRLAVNCKALAPGVLESELFGHEKGAFTGATQARAGLFERADGGTLFLDEIGEIDLSFQAKLLRVLQEREVVRVGGDVVRPVDVRIIAATNKTLQEEVAAGRFREDLYYRLAVIPIHLPPLRERPDDILPLAKHFLLRWNEELGRSIIGWTPEVEAFLQGASWPGNIRELENVIERAAVLAEGELLTMDDLMLPTQAPTEASVEAEGLSLHAYLDQVAAERIRQVLRETQGVRVDAARKLGVERTTLYRLIKKFKISELDL